MHVNDGLPNDPNQVNIEIGGGLLSAGHLSFPASGLRSQAIINADTSGAVWQGFVTVGGVRLEPPTAYNNLPSSIGGGAVGLARFRLHRLGSFPEDGAVLDPSGVPSPGNPILMRHYGPVVWDSQNGTPFIITRRDAETGANATDESACFTQTLDSNHTIVRIAPVEGKQIVRGFEYVIERRRFDTGATMENVLRCGLPSGATPPVFDYEPLPFTVCEKSNAAYGDANNDGCVGFADITEVLTNFGFGTDVCGKLGDADRNGTVNFADVAAVLTFFGFEYCPDCVGGSSFSGPGGDGFAAMGLDRESGASAAAGVVLDALRSMGYESMNPSRNSWAPSKGWIRKQGTPKSGVSATSCVRRRVSEACRL